MTSVAFSLDAELEHLFLLWEKRSEASEHLSKNQNDSDAIDAYGQAQDEQVAQISRIVEVVNENDIDHGLVLNTARRVWKDEFFLEYIENALRNIPSQ